ncbi:MAG: tetratricopeptide repeat protein [Bacteroidetes bacterium]|nr:tetratricopeptide repeat protein [Bacteroidota bacterium]
MKHLAFHIFSLLLIVNISWNSNNLAAQEKLNFSQIDKLTYEYYSQKKWDELINLGKQSLKNDIDFYYLQYRMGIAYYSQKNYRKAIPYFEKVVDKSPKDAIAKEYLYYSYLLGMQTEDARKIFLSFYRKNREKVKFYNYRKAINSLALVYKYSMFNDYAVNNVVVENLIQKVRNSMGYYSVNLLNYTATSSVFDFNFSLLNGNNSIFDATYSSEIIEEKLNQYQLYFSWNKNLAVGSNLKLGISYMLETIKWYDSKTTSGVSQGNKILIYNGSTNNFVIFLSYTRSIKNVDLSIASSFSSINAETLIQPSLSLTYYPFGNSFLYTETSAFYQYNVGSETYNNLIIKQSLNSNLNSKLSINIFGLYGEIYSFVDNGGLSIYNNLDALNYWYGLNANYSINKTMKIYLVLRNDGMINHYTQDGVVNDKSYGVKSILAGMLFNF